ncbi:MAG: class I SAM-dependent methyltransferase [Deltaproteobacteria bacterium]|nr:class I SAM-dependent methyltransferase [Deltaproteobacteria bacterium]
MSVPVENRKEIEAAIYNQMYSARQVNADPLLRETLLGASEDYFRARIVEVCRGKRVLEIGFGDGAPSILAAQVGARVDAIDIAPEAVAFAQESASRAGVSDRISFSVMDVEKMSFPDASFDVIIDNEVFSSLDLRRAVPELCRVLKVGGLLLGKETFGHNPILNLKRKINMLRGARSKWAVAHVLREEDLGYIGSILEPVSRRHLHLLVLVLAPLPALGLRRLAAIGAYWAQMLDDRILRIPFLRRQSFKVVFEFRRGSRSTAQVD